MSFLLKALVYFLSAYAVCVLLIALGGAGMVILHIAADIYEEWKS